MIPYRTAWVPFAVQKTPYAGVLACRGRWQAHQDPSGLAGTGGEPERSGLALQSGTAPGFGREVGRDSRPTREKRYHGSRP